MPDAAVVVPWHNPEQIQRWKEAWGVREIPDWLILQQDRDKQGCARTKNAGLQEAMRKGFEWAVVLDDDCFPSETPSLEILIERHRNSLESKRYAFAILAHPPSRGTPHKQQSLLMPAAASMGFWNGVGDLDAPTQLVRGTDCLVKRHGMIHGEYFPLSGMNLAFRLEWWPWCQFVDVPRYDDIWMGWLWMKRAYALGYCFSLDGPTVRHERQSDVWANLRAEAPHMEANETLWQKIATAPTIDYDELRRLLPCG